jgi:hypothetical protein
LQIRHCYHKLHEENIYSTAHWWQKLAADLSYLGLLVTFNSFRSEKERERHKEEEKEEEVERLQL